jgi:hypothetical protein
MEIRFGMGRGVMGPLSSNSTSDEDEEDALPEADAMPDSTGDRDSSAIRFFGKMSG